MAEQRKVIRARTVFRASIIFNNRNSSIDCLVRNFSESGAKIIVDELITFPQQFELHIPQKGRTFTALVIWRIGKEVGVGFVNEMVNQTAIPTGPGAGHGLPVGAGIADKMRELERENAKLKKLVADLQQQMARYQDCG